MKHSHLYGERAKSSETIDYGVFLARNNMCAVA